MNPLKSTALFALLLSTLAPSFQARAEYPVERPVRKTPAAAEGTYTIHPDQSKQVIKGLGFEIQSDSIASGNRGLPEAFTSVPHDLTQPERDRLCREMLKGFRYCRLAGGLYWRGLDPEQKYLQPRWPEQLSELREMMLAAGIEGVSMEYWSPAPYWKSNRRYVGGGGIQNVLRCFGRDFANDPDYHGDVDRFLNDFAQACQQDLKTLQANGIPISFWGLQNEPFADTGYSSCLYNAETYTRAFRVVAPMIRAFDPKINIIADTSPNFGSYVKPVLANPEEAPLIDSLVIHHVGSDSNAALNLSKSAKPHFQNEFEYLEGPTSPARCLNTVQHIMNWFQLGEAPTWFWIHALKPIGNSEASGYSLGFWRPANDTNPDDNPKFPGLKPGSWTWNKYNWYAVGSFLRHMPWNSQAVALDEEVRDPDLRLFAFKRPDGKLVVVLSNRSFSSHVFHLNTGLPDAIFKGYRYTPEEAGTDFQGVPVGDATGAVISPKLDDMTWEFWEQQ